MSRVVNKKTLLIGDVWQSYVELLLKENPLWWSRYKNYMPNYVIYRHGVNGEQKVVEVMNYTKFRKIIEVYFTKAKKYIIEGEALDMYCGVGKVLAKMVERDFRKPGQLYVNWEATNKMPKVFSEEKKKMVPSKVIYYTDDDWCRIGWNKNRLIKNETMYEFAPTEATSTKNSGQTGFKKEFSQALNKDPLLKYRYQFHPVIYT